MALFGRETREDQARAQAYGQWLRSQNPYAIASLVLGIFSLIEFGALMIFGVGGIVTGVLALRSLARNSIAGATAPANGRLLAWGGIVTSAISLGLAGLLYLRVFG